MCLEVQILFVVRPVSKWVREENQVGPNMPTMINNKQGDTSASCLITGQDH